MIAFIVDLQDKPGELARVTEAIAQKGINIEGFSGATAGGHGAVILVTNDEEGTRRALADAGCQVKESELVTASLAHQPGSLAAAARKLADAGINIQGALPVGMSEGKVSVAFATDQPAKARELIGSTEPAGIGIG
jgi:hypothetical protein